VAGAVRRTATNPRKLLRVGLIASGVGAPAIGALGAHTAWAVAHGATASTVATHAATAGAIGGGWQAGRGARRLRHTWQQDAKRWDT